MTFAEFKTRVIEAAFPLGEPENLSHDDYVVSALIELQRWIKCFRYRHDDVVAACRTYWHCGATVVTAPRGKILRVYTVDRGEDGTDWCRPVVLTPVSLTELRRWQAKFRGHWETSLYLAPPPAPNSGRNLPMGFDVPTASSDAASGRALTGVYALDAPTCRLYVAPWLQSTESLVIEWQGIKRTWTDTDLVPDDADFLRLARLFVEREYGRKWNATDLPVREKAFSDALADLIVTCEEESKLHGEPGSAEEADNAAFAPYVAPVPAPVESDPESTRVIFVGDFGDGGAQAETVAEAVVAEGPDLVVSLGDSKYAPTSALTALDPYSDLIVAGKFRAALGDNDLNDGSLGADVTTYVGNPGNGRYFVQRAGPVSVFVINGGLTSDNTLVEPDGNYPGSRQWQEVTSAILRDTAPWKIAVVHQPPFTSGADYYPGTAALRWLSDLPVHAVLSGHSRNYERLVVRNRLHLVAGTGGLPLQDFNEEAYPGSELRTQEFGYLRLVADCSTATIEFVDSAGAVVDSAELEATAASQPPVTAVEDPRITDQPISKTVDAGETLELALEAAGTATLLYQWYRNNVAIAGATSDTYTTTADQNSAGLYRCVVSNSLGAVSSVVVTVVVTGEVAAYPDDGGPVVAFPSILAFQQSSTTALVVTVAADENGLPATFVRSETPGTDDGHMVVVTGNGNTYRRPL